MADGRKKNGGKRKGAGNPGYAKSVFLKEQVDKFSPIFWQEMNRIMTAKVDDYLPKKIVELVKTLIGKDEYYAKEILKYLARGAMEDKKFAMAEFNKIQVKMIPQDITSGGEKLELNVILDMCET